jgi:hypothetical protein
MQDLTPIFDPYFVGGNRLRLEQVRLYETPNNWADCVRD